MKKGVFLLINVMLMSFLGELYAQNSLWLMNGKKLTIGNYEIIQNEDENTISFYNERGKYKKLELIDVFSVTEKENDENFFHKPDFFLDGEVTEDEIRNFVQGKFDARLYYKDKFSFISSFPVGFVSIFYPPLSNIIFFPVYPSAYIGVLGLTSADYKQIEIEGEINNDKFYVMGYTETAKNRRIRNGLLGAGAGILTGVAIAFLE